MIFDIQLEKDTLMYRLRRDQQMSKLILKKQSALQG